MLRITPGERRVLQLLAEGARRSELAASLQLPELELECRLATLFGRMGVRTDAEAAAECVKRGLLWRSTQELQLRAIEEVNLEQGLLGRLFNFGRLELRGTGVDDVRLPALADPMGLRRELQDGMAAAVAAGRPEAPPARAPAA